MYRVIAAIAAIFFTLSSSLVHCGEANPEAARIIAEFSLREAEQPISKNPDWQPRRVVVSLPARWAQRMPGLEQQLREVAGDAELYIDRSEGFLLSAEVLEGTDAIITVCNPASMANATDSLLWLHSYTVGIDRCAGLPAEQVEGLLVTNSKRLSGPAIAEHTIAMMMSLSRGLPAYSRAEKWDRSPAAEVRFGEIKGKTMLVVGLGGIGSQIAWRAHGLGMRVIATRNSSRSGPEYVDYVGLSDELLELAAQADVVVNALPLTPKTTGLFDKAFFQAIKPGALFLSVGRGKSTVTDELLAALASGKVYGAGLDVTDPEPLPADSPLWQMNNVIITPHISASGADSMQRVALIATENLRRYVAGERMLSVVNMQAGY